MTFLYKGPWFTNMRVLATVDPNNLQYILTKHPENFLKGSKLSEIFDEFLGEGIFNSESSTWNFHRKLAQSFLNHPNFFHTLTHIAWEKVENGLIPILDHASKHQIEVDLQDILLRFMYDTLSAFMMEYDPRSLSMICLTSHL
ncbi:Noroxomaritidine synthase [Bienertia sinuspersici]